jgi:hypothetical protein
MYLIRLCHVHAWCLQEAELFRAWVEAEEAKVAAAEAAAAVEDQEDLEEGPTLPGQALINKAKANLGGFMLPGEGDRWVVYAVSCIALSERRSRVAAV